MTLATPLLAVLVAAVAVPALVILYFLKLRRKPLEISTTLLWKKAILDIQANAPFQKLRRNILLLLQLIILALLILALAQPRTERAGAGGRRVVIMLDRSASMSATDADPALDDWTRLDEAKKRAIDTIETLREPGVFQDADADEAMIVAFDAAAQIIQPFTTDKRALVEAVRSVTPTDAPTSIAEAYRLAQAQRPTRRFTDTGGGDDGAAVEVQGLKGGPAYTFHLFSDGNIPDAEVFKADAQQQGEPPSFEYHMLGDPNAHNLGIIALRADRAFDNPDELSIFVAVQGTQPQPRDVDVELLLDGGLASVRAVTVPGAAPAQPGGASTPGVGGVVFELTQPDAVQATVRLAGIAGVDGNALPTDDQGILIVPPAKRAAVALVTPGSLFLSEALRGLPLSRLETISPDQYEAWRDSGEINQFDVVVLDRYLPKANTAGSPLDPGRYLIFGAVPPPPLGAQTLEESGSTAIIDWRRDHPVLRDLTLDGLVLGKSSPLRIPEESGVVSLAETPKGSAIIEISDGPVRALATGFDLAQTNWPFQVGFVVFLGSAIEYLGANVADPQGPGARQIAPGGVLSDRLPADARAVRVIPPLGDAQELVPGLDARVVYGPIRHQGVYRLQWTGTPGETDTSEGARATRLFAANLLDPDESDITPVERLGLADRVVTPDAADAQGSLELWPFIVLGALAVMLLEWWVYNKRVSL